MAVNTRQYRPPSGMNGMIVILTRDLDDAVASRERGKVDVGVV